MRIANLVSGVILIVFGAIMLLWIIPVQIEEGPAEMMSPRLLPQMMIWLIIALSVSLVASNLRINTKALDVSPISLLELLALAKIGTVFAVALSLFLATGPLLAGVALITGAQVVLGERRPLVIALIPFALIGGTYLLFYRLLGTAIM
jgi:putative tricarboxylic transport membrane protein